MKRFLISLAHLLLLELAIVVAVLAAAGSLALVDHAMDEATPHVSMRGMT